ncbi:hypothetical protein ACFL0E_00150 [Nanoarchaeota archaeon]
MNKLREFHITDLPDDRIFVFLKEKFHKELFNFIGKQTFKEFNLKVFNNKLKLNTFKQWKNRKHFFPLWFIVKIQQRFGETFSLSQIESNIKSFLNESNSSFEKFLYSECGLPFGKLVPKAPLICPSPSA